MKARKLVLLVLSVCALVAFLTATSYAALATYTCTVNYAGPVTSTGTYHMAIKLTYASGSPTPTTKTKVFYAPTGHEKEFLAVALTAMANSKKVSAYVDFDTVSSTTVYNLYLQP
jgi:hypothetical protein